MKFITATVTLFCVLCGVCRPKPLRIVDLFESQLREWQNFFRPHLLWCGVGNRAPTPDVVSSVYPRVDQCCRLHDHCRLTIDRGTCFPAAGDFQVCNPSGLLPILSCKCELKFRKCLQVGYSCTFASREKTENKMLRYIFSGFQNGSGEASSPPSFLRPATGWDKEKSRGTGRRYVYPRASSPAPRRGSTSTSCPALQNENACSKHSPFRVVEIARTPKTEVSVNGKSRFWQIIRHIGHTVYRQSLANHTSQQLLYVIILPETWIEPTSRHSAGPK